MWAVCDVGGQSAGVWAVCDVGGQSAGVWAVCDVGGQSAGVWAVCDVGGQSAGVWAGAGVGGRPVGPLDRGTCCRGGPGATEPSGAYPPPSPRARAMAGASPAPAQELRARLEAPKKAPAEGGFQSYIDQRTAELEDELRTTDCHVDEALWRLLLLGYALPPGPCPPATRVPGACPPPPPQLHRFGIENTDALMPGCGVHYLWFAFVCFLIRSHPPIALRCGGRRGRAHEPSRRGPLWLQRGALPPHDCVWPPGAPSGEGGVLFIVPTSPVRWQGDPEETRIFFCQGPPLGTAPRDHQPPTINRHQPPTANRHRAPISNHQPPPTTTNRHQPPPTASRQPPTANRPLPTHGVPTGFFGKTV